MLRGVVKVVKNVLAKRKLINIISASKILHVIELYGTSSFIFVPEKSKKQIMWYQTPLYLPVSLLVFQGSIPAALCTYG